MRYTQQQQKTIVKCRGVTANGIPKDLIKLNGTGIYGMAEKRNDNIYKWALRFNILVLLTPEFCFHILNVRIWKLANCSSFTMPMCISPYISVLSSAGGQYCMHITFSVPTCHIRTNKHKETNYKSKRETNERAEKISKSFDLLLKVIINHPKL